MVPQRAVKRHPLVPLGVFSEKIGHERLHGRYVAPTKAWIKPRALCVKSLKIPNLKSMLPP